MLTVSAGILIDMCQIPSDPNEDDVKHEYSFKYRVKATFVNITYVITFEHHTSPNLN